MPPATMADTVKIALRTQLGFTETAGTFFRSTPSGTTVQIYEGTVYGDGDDRYDCWVIDVSASAIAFTVRKNTEYVDTTKLIEILDGIDKTIALWEDI